MRTEAPSISVAIAAYNSEAWIAETIDSILAQTVAPLELIVIDDGSTDGTVGALARFGSALRLISQANAGVSAALNRAFELARGDYVALCGADDLWPAAKLEWQTETLTAHPEVQVLFGHARLFGTVEREFPRPASTGVLDPALFVRELYESNVIPAPSSVISRRLHADLGGFREDLAGEDYEFWMRALRAGALFYYDPRLLLHYRRHGDNLSMPGARRDARFRRQLDMTRQIHESYADLVPANHARMVMSRDACDLGRLLVDLGECRQARGQLWASLRLKPSLRALVWLGLSRFPIGLRQRLVAAVGAVQRLSSSS
jgi:glycosyltransferase involved in cell wall biosynthesis